MRSRSASKNAPLVRAAIMALAIVVQLMTPALTLRASAFEATSCLALSGGTAKKKPDHGQSCIHCPSHVCAVVSSRSYKSGLATAFRIAAKPKPAQIAVQPVHHPQQTGPPGAS